jgi:uncharacterized protein YigA (DUF484 family)
MTPATFRQEERVSETDVVREALRADPAIVREDPELMQALGLRIDAANLVDFGPAALARVSAAHKAEETARQTLESVARANFAAQAQAHAAVIDLLDARNHADLARRVDHIAVHRFGLIGGVIALEGPTRVPSGWRSLVEGQADLILGVQSLHRMGPQPIASPLLDARASEVRSMALARMEIWAPERTAILAFASADPQGFTPDMGAELITFLAQVVERTAERWPVLV